jgi:hypothetical protein
LFQELARVDEMYEQGQISAVERANLRKEILERYYGSPD